MGDWYFTTTAGASGRSTGKRSVLVIIGAKKTHKQKETHRTPPFRTPPWSSLCGGPSPGEWRRRGHPHKEFKAALGAPSFFMQAFLYAFFRFLNSFPGKYQRNPQKYFHYWCWILVKFLPFSTVLVFFFVSELPIPDKASHHIHQKFRKGVGGQEILEVEASFLHPFSYAPLGEEPHTPGDLFSLLLGICWSPTPSRQPLFETSEFNP